MKEIMQMSKRRRVYSAETFSFKYLAYLLQALMCSSTSNNKLSSGEKNEHAQNLDIKKRVRFEIDMAMLVSVGTRFKWTQTLKRKLDSYQWIPITSVPISLNMSVEIRREKRRSKRESEMEARERDDELRECVDLLRELVPINGDEVCSMSELIGEVVSYVSCLQFQVGVLRSLVSSSNSAIIK